MSADNQERLVKALLEAKSMRDEAVRKKEPSCVRGDVRVTQGAKLPGLVACIWPECTEVSHRTSCIVKRDGMAVEVWDITFHYAEAGHIIASGMMSKVLQETLIRIFGY